MGYVLYSAMGSFYIPSCIMVFVYIQIYYAARDRARRQIRKPPRPKPQSSVVDTTTDFSLAESTKLSSNQNQNQHCPGRSPTDKNTSPNTNPNTPSPHLISSPVELNAPPSSSFPATTPSTTANSNVNNTNAPSPAASNNANSRVSTTVANMPGAKTAGAGTGSGTTESLRTVKSVGFQDPLVSHSSDDIDIDKGANPPPPKPKPIEIMVEGCSPEDSIVEESNVHGKAGDENSGGGTKVVQVTVEDIHNETETDHSSNSNSNTHTITNNSKEKSETDKSSSADTDTDLEPDMSADNNQQQPPPPEIRRVGHQESEESPEGGIEEDMEEEEDMEIVDIETGIETEPEPDSLTCDLVGHGKSRGIRGSSKKSKSTVKSNAPVRIGVHVEGESDSEVSSSIVAAPRRATSLRARTIEDKIKVKVKVGDSLRSLNSMEDETDLENENKDIPPPPQNKSIGTGGVEPKKVQIQVQLPPQNQNQNQPPVTPSQQPLLPLHQRRGIRALEVSELENSISNNNNNNNGHNNGHATTTTSMTTTTTTIQETCLSVTTPPTMTIDTKISSATTVIPGHHPHHHHHPHPHHSVLSHPEKQRATKRPKLHFLRVDTPTIWRTSSSLSINGDVHILGTLSRSCSRLQVDADPVSDVDPSSSDSGAVSRCAVVKPLKLRLCQPFFGKGKSSANSSANNSSSGGGGGGGGSSGKARRDQLDIGKLNSPKEVRDPEREKRRIARKKEKRATLILGLIMGSFILCWLPFFILYVAAIWWEGPSWGFTIAFWLGYMNSGLNPVIYTIFNKDFRRAFRRILFR